MQRKRLVEVPREERRLVEGYRKGFYLDCTMREEIDHLHKEQTISEERRRDLERSLSTWTRHSVTRARWRTSPGA